MRYVDQPTDCCSIARTVALAGDRWSTLILRDMSNGVHRFGDLATHLGIARDVLTRRLNTLTDAGLVERRPYQEFGSRERHDYRLTAAGRDFVPVLIALMNWGDTHLAGPEGPPVRLYHADCGAPIATEIRCAAGHTVAPGRAIHREFNPAAAERPS